VTDEEREDADRALEIAAIYRIYEEELKKADAVDFGDLVVMAGDLVNSHPEVQAYVAGFKHILVGEFQDVNFASAESLMRLISADRAPGSWENRIVTR
jgi:DNA helicase-2/ATP-dependent DNA helicase PcrA